MWIAGLIALMLCRRREAFSNHTRNNHTQPRFSPLRKITKQSFLRNEDTSYPEFLIITLITLNPYELKVVYLILR